MLNSSLPHRLTIFSALFVVGIFSGCSTLGLDKAGKQMADIPVNSTDLYRVEMHGSGDPVIFDGYIDNTKNNPSSVQTALEASGAVDKFKRMEINVYRKVEDSGRAIKMPVTYEPGRDAVRVDQDYALHPGDRIVVTPIKQSIMSVVKNGLLGG